MKNKIIDIFKNINKKDLFFKNNKTQIIYDYIDNPEFILLIKDNEVKEKKYFLSIDKQDLKYPICDSLGQELKILLPSDIIKLKAEYRLYKDLIEKYEEKGNYDIASNYKLHFFSKWYK